MKHIAIDYPSEWHDQKRLSLAYREDRLQPFYHMGHTNEFNICAWIKQHLKIGMRNLYMFFFTYKVILALNELNFDLNFRYRGCNAKSRLQQRNLVHYIRTIEIVEIDRLF